MNDVPRSANSISPALAAKTPIDAVRAWAYHIPTDAPEADGTATWDGTTLIVVEVSGCGETGLGMTYTDAAVIRLLHGVLAQAVIGLDCFDIPAASLGMQRQVRNIGRPGVAACGISAIDSALWDLKAKLLACPLTRLWGRCRNDVRVYGSGGFTTYSEDRLEVQFRTWAEDDGCLAVKMKVGSNPEADPHRIQVARSAIGNSCKLFIDANGAFTPRPALELLGACAEADISWFEEPVSSDDLAGLRQVRDRLPAMTELAAGEYIYTLDDARRLLESGAVDVLQADATRCCGLSGFLEIAALCDAYHVDLSAHCAPSIHRHIACCLPCLRHIEWFHDHVRIEQLLFDGAPTVRAGKIAPDLSRPGHGLAFKFQDAEKYLLH